MFVTIVDADDLDLFIHRLDHRGTDGAVNAWGRSTSYKDAKTLARCLHSVHLSFNTCRPSIGFFYDNAPLQYTDITGRLNLPSGEYRNEVRRSVRGRRHGTTISSQRTTMSSGARTT